MADLFDYLDWRGDIPLEQVPLNAVDTLILTTFCYVSFKGIVPEGPQEQVPLAQAAKAFLALPKEERAARVRSRSDEKLVGKLMNSPRFAALELSCHVERLEEQCEMQFSATAVRLGSGGTFLAYRGTDNTLVGWKEDFNMSFQDAIPAQWTARDYLERCAAWFAGPLYLGGHSKGGNLAVFAGAMCRPQVRNRIRAVYNHDGPGFTDLVMNSPGYRTLVSRIYTFVPQSSVVGMLLEHRESYSVVKSRQIGVFQHDPYFWEIMGGDFIRVEDVSEGSRLLDQTLKSWLAELSKKEREEFVDGIYELIQSADVDRVRELIHPKSFHAILKAFRNEDEASRRRVGETLGQLVKTAIQTGLESRKEE